MSESIDAIRWRDELLQIMYWYRGEGFGDSVTPDDLVVFLSGSVLDVRSWLLDLVADGYATESSDPAGRFSLTEWGMKEGGRRFADEFAGLTAQGHGECNNPNCACHTLGPEACHSHTPHTHAHAH